MKLQRHHDIGIPAAKAMLWGDLHLPPKAAGLVVFAHGSGTTRRDPLNQRVARSLERAGFATLLVELLDEPEAHERHDVFDVELQAERLVAVADWLGAAPRTRSLRLGYFGTGVGTGAVLIAAAKAPARVAAIVSRGGRPDTALHYLDRVKAPTLFISHELGTIPNWIEVAHRASSAEKKLVYVRGARQLFEEPGAIDAVARHARRWFSRYLAPAGGKPVRQRARPGQAG